MASVDYKRLAPQILDGVGGEANIRTMTHCATRLRLVLKDEALADKAGVERLPGVITVMRAGGQFQVVIGDNVPKVYAALGEITRLTADSSVATDEGPRGNILNQFIALISSIFTPILWPLAGIGLLKAFLAMAVQFHALSGTGQTYTILNAAADGLFTFLPLFLAVTAAKRFRTNQFTSMAIAAALVYPSIVALNTTGAPVHFFGIPVTMMSYTSSVIPILVGVWLQGYLERFLERVLPDAIRNFMLPLLSVLIMVPLILITVGPVTMTLAKGISSVITTLFRVAPWLAGALLGGLWQVFVLFGLHWAFIPLMINDLSTQGYTMIGGPLVAPVVAQGAALIAVALRTRSSKRRQVAGPAAVSALFAGITEPGIYGVNLPLRTPFYAGLAGGAVGGAIAAAGHSANTTFAFASLLALPAWSHGSFTMQIIGVCAAMAIGFIGTFLLMDRESADIDATLPDATAAGSASSDAPAAGITSPHAEGPAAAGDAGLVSPAGTTTLGSPVAGELVDLASVADKVFASGAMGRGFGVIPSDGLVVAPCEGTVVVAMKSGHAYGLTTSHGVEVLVHIGVDTVQMGGRGFEMLVAKGDHVTKGQALCRVDLDAIRAAGHDTTTVVVVTNSASMSEVTPAAPGSVQAGSDACIVTA